MESALEKFGLRKNYSVNLQSSQSDFYQRLKSQVHQKELNFWIFLTERYIKTDKPYVGSCSPSKFEIKKRTRFFGTEQNHTIATGKYYEQGDQLRLEISLGILSAFVQFYIVFSLIGLLTFILLVPNFELEVPTFVFVIAPLLFLVAIAINLVVYRNNLRKFEKEFNLFLSRIGHLD